MFSPFPPSNTELPQSFLEAPKKNPKRHPIHKKKGRGSSARSSQDAGSSSDDIPNDVQQVLEEIDMEEEEQPDENTLEALGDIWLKAGELDDEEKKLLENYLYSKRKDKKRKSKKEDKEDKELWSPRSKRVKTEETRVTVSIKEEIEAVRSPSLGGDLGAMVTPAAAMRSLRKGCKKKSVKNLREYRREKKTKSITKKQVQPCDIPQSQGESNLDPEEHIVMKSPSSVMRSNNLHFKMNPSGSKYMEEYLKFMGVPNLSKPNTSKTAPAPPQRLGMPKLVTSPMKVAAIKINTKEGRIVSTYGTNIVLTEEMAPSNMTSAFGTSLPLKLTSKETIQTNYKPDYSKVKINRTNANNNFEKSQDIQNYSTSKPKSVSSTAQPTGSNSTQESDEILSAVGCLLELRKQSDSKKPTLSVEDNASVKRIHISPIVTETMKTVTQPVKMSTIPSGITKYDVNKSAISPAMIKSELKKTATSSLGVKFEAKNTAVSHLAVKSLAKNTAVSLLAVKSDVKNTIASPLAVRSEEKNTASSHISVKCEEKNIAISHLAVKTEENNTISHQDVKSEENKTIWPLEVKSEENNTTSPLAVKSEDSKTISPLEVKSDDSKTISPLEVKSDDSKTISPLEVKSEDSKTISLLAVKSEDNKTILPLAVKSEEKITFGSPISVKSEEENTVGSPISVKSEEENTASSPILVKSEEQIPFSLEAITSQVKAFSPEVVKYEVKKNNTSPEAVNSEIFPAPLKYEGKKTVNLPSKGKSEVKTSLNSPALESCVSSLVFKEDSAPPPQTEEVLTLYGEGNRSARIPSSDLGSSPSSVSADSDDAPSQRSPPLLENMATNDLSKGFKCPNMLQVSHPLTSQVLSPSAQAYCGSKYENYKGTDAKVLDKTESHARQTDGDSGSSSPKVITSLFTNAASIHIGAAGEKAAEQNLSAGPSRESGEAAVFNDLTRKGAGNIFTV
uniref:Uncharacterized protein n=1 Tax=Timema genevievae TaxID=629358 RepID=A0A7R9K044_TIMGE|nr:unnamed protein product [Timema genevievae]